jgi:WhiB family redox-sensing transcriptional regulator
MTAQEHIASGEYTWDEFGLCNGSDSAHWFPGPGDHAQRRAAIAECQRCPVRAECLTEAIRLQYPGIWGGTTEAERKRLVRA